MPRVGDHNLNVVTESTFGTAPSTGYRSFEVTNESLALSIDRIESEAIRASRRVLSSTSGFAAGNKSVGGDIELEIPTAGFGFWLEHLLGGTTATATTGSGSAQTWTHTAKVGALDGKSFTAQAVRTDISGTSKAFNYLGSKIASFEIGAETGGFATAKLSVDARDEVIDSPAAKTAAYTTSVPMVYTGATISIESSAVACRSFSLKGDNNLATDRYFLGGNTKSEQVEAALRRFEGSISVDWKHSDALYSKFTAGSVASIVAKFEGASVIGTSATKPTLLVTLPACRFDGTTPVGGGQIIQTEVPFVALDNGGSDTAVKFEYTSSDSTP
jgi:hypothetical protein